MIQISILRERNINRGVLISSLITVGSYITISIISIVMGFGFAGFYLFADVNFVLGSIFGIVITLNNRLEHQSILKSGVIVGIIGGISSSFLISLYEMISSAIFFSPNVIIFFFFLGLSLITGIVVGLIVGALIGTYYTYRDLKKGSEEETIDDDFFDDLIKK